MKSLKLALTATAMTAVDYMGGTVECPENHNYIALTKLRAGDGSLKAVITSFEVVPNVSAHSGYIARPGTEHRILGEVVYQEPQGSLRKVRGLDRSESILQNAEELALKMQRVLESDTEDKIHAIFCPDHGIFTEFLEFTAPMLDDHFTELDAEDNTEADAEPKIVNLSGKQVPEEILNLLHGILPIIKGNA